MHDIVLVVAAVVVVPLAVAINLWLAKRRREQIVKDANKRLRS